MREYFGSSFLSCVTMMTKRKDSAEKAIKDIRRATRRQYSAEEKIRIVLEGLRGEHRAIPMSAWPRRGDRISYPLIISSFQYKVESLCSKPHIPCH